MTNNNLPSNTWSSGDTTIRFSWIKGGRPSDYEPYTQAYGVCYNDKGEILIQRFKDSDWSLPGGTVEAGESPESTLIREFIEETDVNIKNIKLLGAQHVEYLKGHNPNPPKRGSDDFYQLRFYCEVDEIFHQTPDPDHGEIRERKFVNPEEITKYFDWGETGKAIFSQAQAIFEQTR